MKPNFLFVGPDKAGSSWLFRVLAAHPEVFLSPAKDIYFFDRYYDRGEDWYLSRFRDAQPQHKVVGEICHDYLYSREAPKRIIETLGEDTRILVCLREPADRAYSDYLNRLRSGEEGIETFATAVARRPEIIRAGEYSKWLQNYIEAFPRSNVKVAVFDDLSRDPQKFLDEITDWLGLGRLVLSTDQLAPARPAATSRSKRLTRLIRSGATVARRLGLEALVGRLKSSSAIEGALYRQYERKPEPDAAVVAQIRAEVSNDVAELTHLTGVPFQRIWGYDV